MSSTWLVNVYVGGIGRLSKYFLHRHEAGGYVQLLLVMLWEICMVGAA